MLPAVFEDHVEDERKLARLTSKTTNRALNAFGIKVVDNMIKAEGKQLIAPTIRYSNMNVEPRSDGVLDWKTGNRLVAGPGVDALIGSVLLRQVA